jgi:hypothetical protein
MTATMRDAGAPQRQCLPCTACCGGWLYAEVNEFILRPGHACPHSTSQGCGIYTERPEVPCRTYVCAWVAEHSPLPDWMRPDQSGAMVLLSLPWEGELVISAIPVGVEIPAHTLDWLLTYARTHRRPMIYYQRLVENGEFKGLKRLGYGPPAFREKIARLGLLTKNTDLDMSNQEQAPNSPQV